MIIEGVWAALPISLFQIAEKKARPPPIQLDGVSGDPVTSVVKGEGGGRYTGGAPECVGRSLTDALCGRAHTGELGGARRAASEHHIHLGHSILCR